MALKKEYEVLTECYGYKGRHYLKGDKFLFEATDEPPKHFKFVRDVEVGAPEPLLFKPDVSALPKDLMRPKGITEQSIPQGGINANIEPPKPSTPVTAGKALANKGRPPKGTRTGK